MTSRAGKKGAAPRQDWRKHAEHRGRQNLELRQALGKIERQLREYLTRIDPSVEDYVVVPVETPANSPAWHAWKLADDSLRQPHVD